MAKDPKGHSKKQTLAKEVDLLRQQVAALAEARVVEAAKVAESPEEAPADSRPESISDGVKAQLETLVQDLRDDLQETPTSTGLAIFALGLLMGRALAR